MNIEDKIEDIAEKLDEILLNQDRLERLLLTITPYRRLPVDLQRRAAHLQNLADSERPATGGRVDTVKRMFDKLCKFSKIDMADGRWPKILAHTMHPQKGGITFKGGVQGAVPYSALVNRCVALKCFALAPGDVSPKASVEEAIRQAGLQMKTMHEAGLVHDSKVKLVMRESEGWAWKYGPPAGEGVFVKDGAKVPVKTEEDEDDGPIIPRKPGFDLAGFLEKERRKTAAENIIEKTKEEGRRMFKPKKEKPSVWAGIALDGDEEELEHDRKAGLTEKPEVESFEESECAQGLTTTRNLVEPDDDEIVEDDEDLDLEGLDAEDDEDGDGEPVVWDKSNEELERALEEDDDLADTTDDVDDDDLGPDEVEFSNPLREQFEREAEEAWAREEAALASGELVLVDGIPVARKK